MNLASELAIARATALLLQARTALALGKDVTPAKLFAMEVLLTQAINDGVTPAEIKESVERLLPEGGALNIFERDQRPVVTLQLPQQRAPVVPSTQALSTK